MRPHFLACLPISSQGLTALQAVASRAFTSAPSTCPMLSSHI